MTQTAFKRTLTAAVVTASLGLAAVSGPTGTARAHDGHDSHGHRWDVLHDRTDWKEEQRERKKQRWLDRKARQHERFTVRLEREREKRRWHRHHHDWKRSQRHWHKHHDYDRDTSFPGVSLNGSQTGGLLGALIGGLAGTQVGKGSGRTAAIVGGTVLGAVLGSNIVRNMDERDHFETNQVLENNRTGQTGSWQNPDTGTRYSLTPERTFRSADNQDCRDYSMWVFIDGFEEEVKGTACRLPDGTWAPVDEQG